jgi:hypothetical protein
MDDRELSPWDLPGYTACAHNDEPFPWIWAVLWFAWGLTVAGPIVWREGAYAVAGCFAAWGMLMGLVGWRTLGLVMCFVRDWAEKHLNDPRVKEASWSEISEAIELAQEGHDFDEDNFEMPDSPTERRWMQEEFFTMALSIPWFLGLIHGVGIGGLLWSLIALIPGLETSVTAAAIQGAVGGAVLVTCIGAVVLAVIPMSKDSLSLPLSLRQRLLVLIGPLLVVPALIEAAVLWGRWYWKRLLGSQSAAG